MYFSSESNECRNVSPVAGRSLASFKSRAAFWLHASKIISPWLSLQKSPPEKNLRDPKFQSPRSSVRKSSDPPKEKNLQTFRRNYLVAGLIPPSHGGWARRPPPLMRLWQVKHWESDAKAIFWGCSIFRWQDWVEERCFSSRPQGLKPLDVSL